MNSSEADIGTTDQWVTALQAIAQPTPRMALADIRLVNQISLTGPRTTQDALRVLTDPALTQILTRTWNTDPPTPELRATLQQDQLGRDLLALADETGPTTVVAGPDTWFRDPRTMALPTASSHAAGSDLAPLLRSFRDDVLGVSVEARGGVGSFQVRVLGDGGHPDRLLALRLRGAAIVVLLVPLTAEHRTVTLRAARPTDIDVEIVANLGSWAPHDEATAVIIEHSVRVADGHAQHSWETIARHAGRDSMIWAAVASGLS